MTVGLYLIEHRPGRQILELIGLDLNHGVDPWTIRLWQKCEQLH